MQFLLGAAIAAAITVFICKVVHECIRSNELRAIESRLEKIEARIVQLEGRAKSGPDARPTGAFPALAHE